MGVMTKHIATSPHFASSSLPSLPPPPTTTTNNNDHGRIPPPPFLPPQPPPLCHHHHHIPLLCHQRPSKKTSGPNDGNVVWAAVSFFSFFFICFFVFLN